MGGHPCHPRLISLDLAPPEPTMPRRDNESSDEYCKETETHYALVELLEQFWQCKDHFASLKATTPQATPLAVLMQLTGKLQHITMMLQYIQSSSLMKNQCTKICKHTWTPWIQCRENKTSS